MKLSVEIDIEIVDSFQDNPDTVARIYYPDEGNKILIKKGLNTIELSEAIFHEIGHLMDWYVSEGKQSKSIDGREADAIAIGEGLRLECNCGG